MVINADGFVMMLILVIVVVVFVAIAGIVVTCARAFVVVGVVVVVSGLHSMDFLSVAQASIQAKPNSESQTVECSDRAPRHPESKAVNPKPSKLQSLKSCTYAKPEAREQHKQPRKRPAPS